MISLTLYALAGCGDGSGVSTSQKTEGPITQAIRKLEKSGKLPVLDRSKDINGPDANNNGIRDDIDAYIAKQGYTDPQRKAVEQYARNLQETLLVDIKDDIALDAVSDRQMKAIHCLGSRFESLEFSRMGDAYEAMTANTESRARAYIAFNHAMDGTTSTLPSEDTCEQ